jgi:hypothetical protein
MPPSGRSSGRRDQRQGLLTRREDLDWSREPRDGGVRGRPEASGRHLFAGKGDALRDSFGGPGAPQIFFGAGADREWWSEWRRGLPGRSIREGKRGRALDAREATTFDWESRFVCEYVSRFSTGLQNEYSRRFSRNSITIDLVDILYTRSQTTLVPHQVSHGFFGSVSSLNWSMKIDPQRLPFVKSRSRVCSSMPFLVAFMMPKLVDRLTGGTLMCSLMFTIGGVGLTGSAGGSAGGDDTCEIVTDRFNRRHRRFDGLVSR